MGDLLVKLWRLFNQPVQWIILWSLHSKFNVCVSGVIFDGQGDVLLLRHRYWGEGSWGLPSGFAIKREEVSDTLRREVKEETNLDIEVIRFLRLASGYKLRVEVSMVAKLLGGELELDMHEILEAKFFSPQALPTGILDTHRELVQLAMSTRGCAQLDHIKKNTTRCCGKEEC